MDFFFSNFATAVEISDITNYCYYAQQIIDTFVVDMELEISSCLPNSGYSPFLTNSESDKIDVKDARSHKNIRFDINLSI